MAKETKSNKDKKSGVDKIGDLLGEFIPEKTTDDLEEKVEFEFVPTSESGIMEFEINIDEEIDKGSLLKTDDKGKVSEVEEGLDVTKTLLEFEIMVKAMRVYIKTDPYAKRFSLRIVEDHGRFYIYQGSRSCIYAILYPKGRCIFPRTSFLRAIRNLPKDSVLFKYFELYNLVR